MNELIRADLRIVAEFVPEGARVLDLGCGDGDLLEYLARQKRVSGRGIELSEDGVLACVRKGLSVRQGDIEEGIADYPDGSFDYVVLSQTLPYLDDPDGIIREMLRVGHRAIVSFPNWGYWRCRLKLLVMGEMPQAPDLPQRWHDRPRWQALTITDFGQFCRGIGVVIDEQAYLTQGRKIEVRKFKNLFSTTGVFVIRRA